MGQNTLTKSLLSNQQSYTFHHTTSTDEVPIDLASEQDPMFNCPMNNCFAPLPQWSSVDCASTDFDGYNQISPSEQTVHCMLVYCTFCELKH